MISVNDMCVLIAGRLPAQPGVLIEPDTPLLEAGLLDSLAVMAVVAAIAEETGVEIPESQIVATHFRSPRHLWELVAARLDPAPR
ncbi:phosphopantetheine-binding protein [Actinoplanes sp. NPDC089786]|uniref:phosphopantetheine-binding protein n=1 Tax=Actinoplanes sp. NPDC089786 TaxID=3155185 RepID=UPI00342913A1